MKYKVEIRCIDCESHGGWCHMEEEDTRFKGLYFFKCPGCCKVLKVDITEEE